MLLTPPESDPSSDPHSRDQWKALRKMVRVRAEKQSATEVFGDYAKSGSIYRWGVGIATSAPCDPFLDVLSRLACDRKVRKKEIAAAELEQNIQGLTERFASSSNDPVVNSTAVVVAAAMPELIDYMDYRVWWDLINELHHYREMALEASHTTSLNALMVAGEVGLTLSWRLADLPSCKQIRASSIDSIRQWCKHEEDSIADAMADPSKTRMAFASLYRCRSLVKALSRKKFNKQQSNVLSDLATWVAALTVQGGGNAFCANERKHIRDDAGKNGLLQAAVDCEPDALEPAVKAALGKSQSGGRLAWEVSLPEAFHHCDESKLAVLMPEWDVHRGRAFLDYSSQQTRLELYAGKSAVLSGEMDTSIELDGNQLQPSSDWESTCEYSDDDVHYLELEQTWTGGVVLQRQLMVVRDDCCVLLADSVLPRDTATEANAGADIRYACRLPLRPEIHVAAEKETREVFLKDKKTRALLMPLAAAEWRIGPTPVTLRQCEEHHLLLTANGKSALYAPLWFDLQRKRLKRKRTWRQLTVADELRIVGPEEAVGFRVQVGTEQWLVYRSLAESTSRSVLGKHLVADFYAGRFYMNDGSVEEIVTVDENG